MLPKLESVNMMTPMLWNRPDLSARAALFGRYPSFCMAASTRSRVSGSTLLRPFETRDTVCADTPASRATSAMDGPRRRPGAASAGVVTVIVAPS